MREPDARRIFERFFRVDPSRSRQHGGAGLGLSIVAAIVHAHGGSVEVSTGPGGGATFTVVLPVEQPKPAGRADRPGERSATGPGTPTRSGDAARATTEAPAD